MKTLRTILGISAMIPLVMIAKSLLHPANYSEGSLGELLFLLIGVPILTLNYWTWTYPEIIEFYFFGKEILQNKLKIGGLPWTLRDFLGRSH